MNKVKVGIVGVGDLGSLHAKLYKDIPDAEVVGIYYVDSNKLNTVADDLGLIACLPSAFSNISLKTSSSFLSPSSVKTEISSSALIRDVA